MKIELLVGMIASGKSTYARQRARQGALVISHDDLTQMLHAEYRYEKGLRECYRRMEENLVREAVRQKRDVVIDRTHLTRESRFRWYQAVVQTNGSIYGPVGFVAVTFPIELPEVHARRRFEADPRGRSYEEWLGVAGHHHAQALAEPLSIDEGFSAVIRKTDNHVEVEALIDKELSR